MTYFWLKIEVIYLGQHIFSNNFSIVFQMIILNTQQNSKKILRGYGSIIQYLFCVSNSGLLK